MNIDKYKSADLDTMLVRVTQETTMHPNTKAMKFKVGFVINEEVIIEREYDIAHINNKDDYCQSIANDLFNEGAAILRKIKTQ